MVLQNDELELLYIVHKLFNMCQKKSCFQDFWKVSPVVPIFTNIEKSSTAKTYHSVSLPPVVCKIFEKLVDIRLVDNLEK